MSVTEMKYEAKEKAIHASVKLFTNDIEDALKKLNGKKVDLINDTDKKASEQLLEAYIKNHLILKVGGKNRTFEFIGYEREEDAIWAYIEYKNITSLKKAEVDNTLLYDFLDNQINIVHFEMNGLKKSSKVTKPEKKLKFEF